MRPPHPDDLPPVARSGFNPAPGRGPFHPVVPFWNSATIGAGVVFLSITIAVTLLTLDPSIGDPGMIGGYAIGALVSWLIVSVRLMGDLRSHLALKLEIEAAWAIPREVLDRVVIHDLAQPDWDSAVARWSAYSDAHYAAGRLYEAEFWVHVNNRAAQILNRKRS